MLTNETIEIIADSLQNLCLFVKQTQNQASLYCHWADEMSNFYPNIIESLIYLFGIKEIVTETENGKHRYFTQYGCLIIQSNCPEIMKIKEINNYLKNQHIKNIKDIVNTPKIS